MAGAGSLAATLPRHEHASVSAAIPAVASSPVLPVGRRAASRVHASVASASWRSKSALSAARSVGRASASAVTATSRSARRRPRPA